MEPQVSIIERLTRGLVEQAKREQEEHPRAPNKLWPSGIGRCVRAQYYSYIFPETYDVKKLAIFATGRAIHSAIPEFLELGGMKVKATELRVEMRHPEKDLRLSGRVDVIVVEEEGREIVVEVKSAKNVPDQPHSNHVLQLQCYLNYLNLESGLILYWGKSSGDIKAFPIKRDPAVMREVWNRAEEVSSSISQSVPPRREGAENGWECLFCEYFTQCYLSADSLQSPLVIAERRIFPQEGRVDSEIFKVMCDALMEDRDIIVLTDLPGPASEERLLSHGVPHTHILPRPPAYDDRWYEKVRIEMNKFNAEILT
ncbi:MAG: PD-(D/E)XK nuclease family protein [Candidatus Methanomethylicaceae archaeon]